MDMQFYSLAYILKKEALWAYARGGNIADPVRLLDIVDGLSNEDNQ